MKKIMLLLLLSWNINAYATNLNTLSQEFTQLTPGIAADIQTFVTALTQWMAGMSDDQAAQLIHSTMIPKSKQLSQSFNRFYALTSQMSQYAQPGSLDAQVITSLQALSMQGQQGFNQWQNLLQQMLQANQAKDMNQLQNLAQSYLPVMIQNTVSFVQQLSALAQQGQNNPAMAGQNYGSNYANYGAANPYQKQNVPSQNSSSNISPEVFRMMSNINQMSHETSMSIINNMGGTDPVDYYQNGTYIGTW